MTVKIEKTSEKIKTYQNILKTMDESDELDLFLNKTKASDTPKQLKISALKSPKSPSIICIFGPRACGKNTLCKHLLAENIGSNAWILVFSNDTQIDEAKYQISHPLLQYRISSWLSGTPNTDFWETLYRALDMQILIKEALLKAETSPKTPTEEPPKKLPKDREVWIVLDEFEGSSDDWYKLHKYLKQAQNYINFIFLAQSSNDFNSKIGKYNLYDQDAQRSDRHISALEVKYTKIYQFSGNTTRPPKYNGLMLTTPQQYSEILQAFKFTKGIIIIENGVIGKLLPTDIKIIDGPVINPAFAMHLDKFLHCKNVEN